MKKTLFIIISAIIFTPLILNAGPAEKVYIDSIDEPVQIQKEEEDIYLDGYILNVKAEYTVEGIVKSKKRYYFDGMSEIAPYDFALAWGKLNSRSLNEIIKYTQSNRWYYYSYIEIAEAGIDKKYVISNSANIHLIPANSEIFKRMKDVRENNHVKMKGKLVDIVNGDVIIKTSMTRNDSGKASCEIMYVEDIHIIK